MNTLRGLIASAALGALAASLGIRRRREREARRLNLRGSVIAITGGSRGLGLVLARQLVAEGARIAICARDEAEVERAERQLQELGGEVFATTCDVTDRDELTAWLLRVKTELGPIAALINNAGIITVGPVEHMTTDDYARALATHFWAPLHATVAVLPDMRARGAGRIVNITSIGGKISVPHLLPYSVSKFALVAYSEGLRAELAKANVHVTTVVPGLMRTGSPPNAHFKGHAHDEFAWFAISDSMPVLSIDAERAAAQIIDAMVHGDAELVLTLPAKLAVRFASLAPAISQQLLALVSRLLPGPSPDGSRARAGHEVAGELASSRILRPMQDAARRNNELG